MARPDVPAPRHAPRPASPPRRLGIVGLGVISRFYLEAARRLPRWEPTAVCDLRDAALDPHRATLACHTDHRALLASGQVDALVVAVPNHAHAEVCADALRAGVPVCVEKPLALDAADGHRLTRLSGDYGVPLFTAFHRRYNDRVTALLRRLPAPGAGGPAVASVRVRYLERIEEHIGSDDWYLDPARSGGGCVADNGPNAFDLVRLVLGDPAVRVTESRIERDGTGLDRRALVTLEAPDGRRGEVELDWSYPGEAKDVVVRLDDGSELRADMLGGRPGFKESLWHEYEGILGDFAGICDAAVRPGTDVATAAAGGMAALELVAAAYAQDEARTPARVEERR
ncbi:Gfo/Idh/MocA family protein [Streptomyces laurentii]|uniref:Gfo/Idh/MocA family protein n=1 Tax=Streptomyces laurentii TaxID=39478 RepID=UPI0036C1E987